MDDNQQQQSCIVRYETTDASVQAICNRYWEQDTEGNFCHTVKAIAQEFHMKPRDVTSLASEHCAVILNEPICVSCGHPLEVRTRSDYQAWTSQRYQVHRNKEGTWECDKCRDHARAKLREEQHAIEMHQRQLLRERFSNTRRVPAKLANLTLEQAVYLLSFIRVSAVEELSMGLIDIRETEPEYRLAPTIDLYFEIIRTLTNDNYIVPHPDSPLDNFNFEGNQVVSYLLKMPQWWLPIGGETDDERGMIAELEHCFAEMDWPDFWFEQVLALWRKIALHECLEYLDMVLREHGFTFEPGEKTIATFEHVLEHFSVAQAFNFIWRAGRDAAAYYMRSGIPKRQAANSVVGNIQRMADKSVAETWDVKGYRRDFRCPQTMVSRVLFDTALHIGDEGFTTIPKKL